MNKLKWVNEITSKKVDECSECALNEQCIATRCLFTNYVTTADLYKPNLVECNMLNLKLKINNMVD